MATNKNIETKPVEAANPVEEVGNPAEEVRQEGDTTPQPSKWDGLKKDISTRYPDDTFDNDDDYYARIADDYANHDKEMKGYKEREAAIGGLFTKDPRSEQFMKDWINGEDPEVAMIRRHGKEDFMAALEDPDKLDEIAKANEEYVSKVAEGRKLEEEYMDNLKESLERIDAYQTENGLSDEQVDNAMNYLVEVSRNVISGKFTPEMIIAAHKATSYDKDVQSAAHEAEVRGKNEKIDMQLRKPTGDGTAQLGSRVGGGASRNTPSIPGALGRQKRNIWDTDTEKRTPAKR